MLCHQFLVWADVFVVVVEVVVAVVVVVVVVVEVVLVIVELDTKVFVVVLPRVVNIS